MTRQHEWDDLGESPWIDPESQARSAEDRIVHALRREGLIRSRPRYGFRSGPALRFVWPVALAAGLAIAFVAGTRMSPDRNGPAPAQVPPGTARTIPAGIGDVKEERGVAFHLVHPLDGEGPPAAKPPVETAAPPPAAASPATASSPAFHLQHPLDGPAPDDIEPGYAKEVQLAAGR